MSMSAEEESGLKKRVGRRALKTPVHGDCQVCGQPAHGSHFGVLACRACAAFFRRTVVMNRQYSCRRANGSCQISKDERYLCRLCRYNKCLQLGMTPDNVQWNRDVLSTTVEGRKPKKASTTPCDIDDRCNDYEPQGGLETGVVQCAFEGATQAAFLDAGARPVEYDSAAGSAKSDQKKKSTYDSQLLPIKPRVVFDISPMMTKLRGIFSDFKPPDADIPEEPLMRMHHALLRHRRNQRKASDLKVVDTIKLGDMMSFWENQLYNTAEWMMHCKEFAQLPLEEKVVIFKNSWMIWQRFERLTVSIELFGWRAVTDKMLALTDQLAIVTDMLKVDDMSSLTDHDPGYIRRMFRPFTGRITEEVTKSCLEISLDSVEVAYVLCTLMWHVEGRRVDADTQMVAEAFREKLSDDLHDYYTLTTKTPNYAGRLIRIMSIVHTIENIHYERSKVMELARIFDIFKVELSEKGMFDY